MTHWGWYWKVKHKDHIRKKLCSNLVQIDSFKVYKKGLSGGFEVRPLDIVATPMRDYLKIMYRQQKNSPYKILIDRVSCNYGSNKIYFKCPLCHQRMRILYLAENSIFLCRKCLNLGYETQRYRPSIRNMMNEGKVSEKIKNLGGDMSINKRPKGMHIKTFEKAKNKFYRYEEKWHQELDLELFNWKGSKVLPFLEYLPT